MWIFLNKAFLSVVQDLDNPDYLLVRARDRNHLHAILVPDENIYTIEGSDYQYRTKMHKRTFAVLISGEIRAINYPKFKSSVKDPKYRQVLREIWSAVFSAYHDEYKKVK